MLFVFNKKKINSYLISLGTVIILFTVSIISTNKINNTIQTSAKNTEMPISKVKTERKEVAISINCSQNVENIDSIIDSLSKMKVSATFYITGEIAEKYPDEIKKIVNNGNEIGSLSDKYTNLKNKSEEEIKNSIVEANVKIEKTIGRKVSTFRPPYGECNETIIKQARSQNLSVVQWNIDSLDYNGLNGEEIWERINENLCPGSIILMHNSAQYAANSLEDIIHNIQEKGYEIKTVNKLIAEVN